LRIAKEIEPEAVGLFLIGAVMTLQTGSDVKFQPRLIEGIMADVVGYSRLTEGDERRSPISRGGEAKISVTVTRRPHLDLRPRGETL
jgi:hypothetical protein